MTSTISWRLLPLEEVQPTTQLEPVVDGRGLVELVDEFEQRQGFEPAGGYAGLTPPHYRPGALPQQFLGRQTPDHRVALLGCACGDLGCWPLVATVGVDEQTVTWSQFEQPHRPDRDYSGFGPFTFDAAEYRRAAAAIADAAAAADHRTW